MSGDPAGAGAGKARRILVVGDQTAQRLVLGRGLAHRGYEVFLAESGVDALAQLTADPGIGAIVCDLAGSLIGGLHFVPHVLRRRPPQMPVLFITGDDASVVPLGHPLIGILGHPVRVTDVCDLLDQLQAAVPAPHRLPSDSHARRLPQTRASAGPLTSAVTAANERRRST